MGQGAVPLTHYHGYRGDVLNAVRGFCMGAADTVPGISGGTIALIMGHYSRLVTAISHFDGHFVQLLATRQFLAAASYVDARFMTALLAGILTGILSLSGLMHYLLDAYLPETLSVFLGLLIASLWVVVQYVDRWTFSRVIACVGGIVFAAIVSSLPTGHGSMSLPFLFFSASVAICAMILPGISGAFVLLVLGVYHPITGLIKDLAKLQVTWEGLLQMTVFALGCLFGLLSFCRVLRRLLQTSPGTTMAALMGLMIGSVGKLYPLQVPTPETALLDSKDRVMTYVAPADWEGSILRLVLLAVASAVIVLTIEWIAAKQSAQASS
jgi:putative membrane protein